jgi:hypothetical protein
VAVVVVAELCVFAGVILNFAWVSGTSVPPPRGLYTIGLGLVIVCTMLTVAVMTLAIIHCKSVCKNNTTDSPTLASFEEDVDGIILV